MAANGVRSIVSFVPRWNRLFLNLTSLLSGGAIGELFYAEVDYWHGLSQWWSGWEWAHKTENGGSTMLLGGCHAVDAIRHFAGREIVEVAAFANNVKQNFEYDANVVAIATDEPLDAPLPQIDLDDAGAVARFIVHYLGLDRARLVR